MPRGGKSASDMVNKKLWAAVRPKFIDDIVEEGCKVERTSDLHLEGGPAETAFKKFDTNGDQKIDAEELQSALKGMGVEVSKDDAARMLKFYSTECVPA